jgi:glycosyltransferase involved in cell wall biosynthesis
VKVLLSAYACSPAAGSEPGVGFETLMAVAARHEVWVLTRVKNALLVSEYLANHPLRDRIHIVPLDLSPMAMRLKRRLGATGLQWYYDRWQSRAGQAGAELQETVGVDVVHHVTFAADWSRAGVADIPAPFVWGPIGGGVTAPIRLFTILGWRGVLAELGRGAIRYAMRRRRWYRSSWRSADVVLTQNSETAALGPSRDQVRLLPNSTAVNLTSAPPAGPRTKEVIVVGRLIAWKGPLLALAAFRRVSDPAATLTFLGSGPEQQRLARAASRWGLTDRVRFEGSIPREDVLQRVARAAVMLHTAVHEENSMAVGEALALGTPVVCLDRGGPPELLRQWRNSPGSAIPVGWPAPTAERLAIEVDRFLAEPPPIPTRPVTPVTSYSQVILDSYETAVATHHGLRPNSPDQPGM